MNWKNKIKKMNKKISTNNLMTIRMSILKNIISQKNQII